jgi:hypothetical protein
MAAVLVVRFIAVHHRQIKALLTRALFGNVIACIGMTHHSRRRIVVKNTAYATRSIISAIATNHHTAMLGESHTYAATMMQ